MPATRSQRHSGGGAVDDPPPSVTTVPKKPPKKNKETDRCRPDEGYPGPAERPHVGNETLQQSLASIAARPPAPPAPPHPTLPPHIWKTCNRHPPTHWSRTS
ncbi:hypothetical protein Bbelb_019180 [Branchiostoma belcheri]|nr:hypothetical protein Bbelb_019180 [Branchiostoma belcheri]